MTNNQSPQEQAKELLEHFRAAEFELLSDEYNVLNETYEILLEWFQTHPTSNCIHMTEDQLRAIVRQEVAAAWREEIKVNHEIKIETSNSGSTAEQMRQIVDEAARHGVIRFQQNKL
jgi:hypothetical protein